MMWEQTQTSRFMFAMIGESSTIIMRDPCKILIGWCCFVAMTTLAFLPSRTSSIAHRHQPSSSYLLDAIGYDDFSKIFGSQEAAERRTRDLAREYRGPPPQKSDDKDDKEERSTLNSRKNGEREENPHGSEDSQGSVAEMIEPSKVITKYVPPPNL